MREKFDTEFVVGITKRKMLINVDIIVYDGILCFFGDGLWIAFPDMLNINFSFGTSQRRH